jgi:rare lipoprotein A
MRRREEAPMTSGERWPISALGVLGAAAIALATAIACGASGCAARRGPAEATEQGDATGDAAADASAAREARPVRVLHGKAVWYGGKWHGRRTASGERFNKHAMTAAHRSLPLGTRIRVINLDNQRSLILRVNDRGPYGRDRSRILDVSEAAARRLGFHSKGWVRVRVEVLEDRGTVRARETPAGRRRR